MSKKLRRVATLELIESSQHRNIALRNFENSRSGSQAEVRRLISRAGATIQATKRQQAEIETGGQRKRALELGDGKLELQENNVSQNPDRLPVSV